MNRVTVMGDDVVGVSGPYTPEANVAPLPDGHHVKPRANPNGPKREFERHLQQEAA